MKTIKDIILKPSLLSILSLGMLKFIKTKAEQIFQTSKKVRVKLKTHWVFFRNFNYSSENIKKHLFAKACLFFGISFDTETRRKRKFKTKNRFKYVKRNQRKAIKRNVKVNMFWFFKRKKINKCKNYYRPPT